MCRGLCVCVCVCVCGQTQERTVATAERDLLDIDFSLGTASIKIIAVADYQPPSLSTGSADTHKDLSMVQATRALLRPLLQAIAFNAQSYAFSIFVYKKYK